MLLSAVLAGIVFSTFPAAMQLFITSPDLSQQVPLLTSRILAITTLLANVQYLRSHRSHARLIDIEAGEDRSGEARQPGTFRRLALNYGILSAVTIALVVSSRVLIVILGHHLDNSPGYSSVLQGTIVLALIPATLDCPSLCRLAYRDETALAFLTVVEASAQSVLFVIPVVVILSWIRQQSALVSPTLFGSVLLVATGYVVGTTTRLAKSNYLYGVLLLAL